MDARPHHRDDIAPRGAQPFHRENRFFQNTQHRATPAGMGAANHASSAIREKRRRAITRDDPKDKTCASCDHTIGFGALVF